MHFNDIQTIKREFFALRNGIVADALRKAGSEHKIIFGLNLPQLKQIALRWENRRDIADTLWQNTSTRESRLLASLIYSTCALQYDAIVSLAKEISDTETADVFAMAVLKKSPDADKFTSELISNPSAILRYMGLRLAYRLVDNDSTRPWVLEIARNEIDRNEPLTLPLARQLAADSDW